MAIPSTTQIALKRTRSAAGAAKPSRSSTTGADGGDRPQALASLRNLK
ncbi:GSCOCG00006668001-RA-CDS, partial [Cotesia congregata]